MRFDAKATPKSKQARFIKEDELLSTLAGLEPDDIESWLTQHANNFVQVRALLKRLVIAVLAIRKGDGE